MLHSIQPVFPTLHNEHTIMSREIFVLFVDVYDHRDSGYETIVYHPNINF